MTARREQAWFMISPPSSIATRCCAWPRRAIDEACAKGYELGYTNIDELMNVIDCLMTYAPPFSEANLIHCPLNAVLDWPMCMPSGYALFRDQAFNAQLKRMLNY